MGGQDGYPEDTGYPGWYQTAAEEKIVAVTKKPRAMKLGNAAKIVEEGAKETLSYYAFPGQHWRSLRTNNPLERLMREIRRRARVVGAFPDGQFALMLVAGRLRHVSATRRGARRYLKMDRKPCGYGISAWLTDYRIDGLLN